MLIYIIIIVVILLLFFYFTYYTDDVEEEDYEELVKTDIVKARKVINDDLKLFDIYQKT
jgi:hypothetical protein